MTGDGNTIRATHTGGGTVLTALRDHQSSYPQGLRSINKGGYEAPKGIVNVCGAIDAATTENCFKTASYYPSTTDSSIYVGMTNFFINLNGFITEMRRANVNADTQEVQSNSYLNPAELSFSEVMALWKVSDFIKDSASGGGIWTAISSHKADIRSINGLLRIKCKLVSSVEDPAYNPIVFKWELHPNFAIESMTYGDSKSKYNAGSGSAYYRNGTVVYDQFAWYIPVARFSLTNCRQFITDLVDNGESSSAFSFSIQQIDFNPTLMLTMSQAQYDQILAAQELINE